ncbi:MAG TPA: hypothetical protein PK264_11595, partial [Hyphomicrobiaceae bacterium]|nr:hypothetical protein [Hyphomicrobiaceae bacterium]
MTTAALLAAALFDLVAAIGLVVQPFAAGRSPRALGIDAANRAVQRMQNLALAFLTAAGGILALAACWRGSLDAGHRLALGLMAGYWLFRALLHVLYWGAVTARALGWL